MANARDIKKRIKAVGNIRRITKTMQMIATSKFAKAQQRALATKPYTEGIFDLVTQLASKAGNIEHPLINGPSGGFEDGAKEVLLVMTSDRGLCGGYNGSVLRLAATTFRAASGTFSPEVIGKKGIAVLKFNRIAIDRQHNLQGDKTTYQEIERIADDYMDRFTAGKIRGVKVAYMKFITTARQKAEVLQLLPLKPPAGKDEQSGPAVQYEFSPPAEELLADLLPVTVRATLFQAFNDAIVSEHVARMIAMKGATDNAAKMGKLFTRRYNRARQSQITTELTEIISGAAALD